MDRFSVSPGSQVLRMFVFSVFPGSQVLKMDCFSVFPGSDVLKMTFFLLRFVFPGEYFLNWGGLLAGGGVSSLAGMSTWIRR